MGSRLGLDGLGGRLRVGLTARALLGLATGPFLLGPAPLLLFGAALRLRLAVGGGRLEDGLADRPDDELAGADRVVVARNRVLDADRVDVRVDEADDRDP